MIGAIGRARLVGGLVLVAAFGAGVAVGRYYPERERAGVMIKVTSGTKIPRELEALSLTDTQRVLIRGHLRAGTERVGRVVRGFTVPMDAAIDSTDREIRSVLTEAQNRRLNVIRKDRPLRVEKRVIDTTR